jgi:succinyl-CoA synthetase beta subunit
VIRLEGNHAREAHELLSQKNIMPIISFSEAAQHAITLAQKA